MDIDLLGAPIEDQPKREQDFNIVEATGTDEWLTPPDILARCGGPDFDLDPCAPVVRPWPTAHRHYTIQDNGLLKPWAGRVWLNPPYSELEKWLARMAEHRRGIALTFARTETKAFQEYVFRVAYALLFIRGRLTFHDVTGKPGSHNSGAPSVLIAYTPEDGEILLRSNIAGCFLPCYERICRAVMLPTNETKLLI